MARVYKSICLEIDDYTAKIMNIFEKQIKCKVEIERLMNEGFSNLAKARYIMGSKCVTTLQLPTENSNPIHALITVSRTFKEGSWVFTADKREPDGKQLSNEKLRKSGDEHVLSDVKDLSEINTKSMRKRKEFYLVDDHSYKELNEELQDEASTDSKASQESLISFTDPLRLFGILVPQTLKIAQKNFKELIIKIAHCANIQYEIYKIYQRLSHLKEIKKMMETAAGERGIDLNAEKQYFSSSEESYEPSKRSSEVLYAEDEVKGEVEASSESTDHEEKFSVESEEEEEEDHDDEKDKETIAYMAGEEMGYLDNVDNISFKPSYEYEASAENSEYSEN